MMPGDARYLALSLAALVLTTWIASRWSSRVLGRDTPRDWRLAIIWLSALAGGAFGAKAAYLVAEAWADRGDWAALVGGRSITGALLGGFVAVELAKRWLGWTRATGDLFAITVPLAIAIGRIGCACAGCCAGIRCEPAWWTVVDASGTARWPSALGELSFQVAFLAWALLATAFGWQRDQRFHIYLIAYGLFRFAHEFLRDDPRWFGPFGGYHAVALMLVVVGGFAYARRAKSRMKDASASQPETGIAL